MQSDPAKLRETSATILAAVHRVNNEYYAKKIVRLIFNNCLLNVHGCFFEVKNKTTVCVLPAELSFEPQFGNFANPVPSLW